MDEPVNVKYVPVDAVKNFIKGHYWLTSDFDELVDIYGIDVVHYKCNVTLSEREASMFEGNAESFVKKRAAEWLSEKLEDHIKCTSVERLPVANARGYRYDVMIGEIPEWAQEGNKNAEELAEFVKAKSAMRQSYYMTSEDAKKVLKINEEKNNGTNGKI